MIDVTNPIQIDVPTPIHNFQNNQYLYRRTTNIGFYNMLPPDMYTFYMQWVRPSLQWYDGYVDNVHGINGLISTGIGTTLVNRITDQIFGGSFKLANSRKPIDFVQTEDGKRKGKALDAIGKWMEEIDGKTVIKKAVRYALAGGFSLIKVNKNNGEVWLDTLRADRFYLEMAGNKIRKSVSIIEFFTNTTGKENSDRYILTEERRFESIGMFGKEIPVIEYRMSKSTEQVQYYTQSEVQAVRWEDLPKTVRKAFKESYGNIRLNEPKYMQGFDDLGVYLMKATDGVSAIPQLNLGESVLLNCMSYLWEYDYYFTSYNTELYLAKGRVLLPKQYQSDGRNSAGNAPQGLDSFSYTYYDSMNSGGEAEKPTPLQFALRANEFRDVRNNILESIATSIGLSVSTLASYLQDGAQRTAREVSSEESATVLFVESMRRRIEEPVNKLLQDVLRYYGFADDVEIRWTKAGNTNKLVQVEVLERAVNAGLMSKKKAHALFNDEEDEEQNEEDYELIQEEQKQMQEQNQNDLWGGVDIASLGGNQNEQAEQD